MDKNTNYNKDEMDFVMNHYHENRLNEDRAWKRISEHDISLQGTRKRKTWAVASCLVLTVGFSTAYAIYTHTRHQTAPLDEPTKKENVKSPARSLQDSTVIFKFEDEPTQDVLHRISLTYGKQVTTTDTTQRVSGEMEVQSLEDAVRILENTLHVEITIQ